MVVITLGDMLDEQCALWFAGCRLYVVRDITAESGEDGVVLYVGATTVSIPDRLRVHLGQIGTGPSRFGNFILDNSPDSDLWVVEGWTIGEAAAALGIDVEPGRVGLEKIERALIAKHRPCLNVAYNPDPREIPAGYRRREDVGELNGGVATAGLLVNY